MVISHDAHELDTASSPWRRERVHSAGRPKPASCRSRRCRWPSRRPELNVQIFEQHFQVSVT
ncbi:hypothetical protein ACU4GD_35515 [Cupriavidus basilensis]